MNHYRLLILFSICVAILGVAFVGSAFMVSAECAGVKAVTPINSFANVRRTASTNASVAYKLERGESKEWDILSSDWYHLVDGGYVHKSVVEEKCQVATATPTPSEPQVTIIRGEDGVLKFSVFCPSACEWTSTVEELP